MTFQFDAKEPKGPIETRWRNHKFDCHLVSRANRRKHSIIIVGTGLAGASSAAALGEMGYHVKAFFIQDSPRRAHSIAAQGGINASKNYKNDGDSTYRLFYETIKGGDYRSRESNVFRLAEISTQIIDHCAAIGVPFAREYGGLLQTRSFGGTQVERTFYARGQTGQQLLLGAYQSMMRQVHEGNVELYPRRDMMDIVVIDGKARGVVMRNMLTGEIESYSADTVLLATGGYGNIFYLSTNARPCNASAAWRAYKKGALFANPCFTQIHPTCLPVSGEHQSKLTLMSESLRNDGRVWVPKDKNDERAPNDIPEGDRDYYLERRYPSFGNLVPRDVASRAAKLICDEGFGVGATGLSVYLDFRDSISEQGEEAISEKYGNLFEMYEKITGKSPYKVPMRIYPAVHYTMGGLWVDYNLMSSIEGLHVLGEANFSDHGANRLGASSLMQGLADGYFIAPTTVSHYIATREFKKVEVTHPAFKDAEKAAKERITTLMSIGGKRTADEFHKALGKIMWDKCGMSRNASGLKEALEEIPRLREEFWKDLVIPGDRKDFNQELEKANRVADFLELSELMCEDALERNESCGGHFREEYQTQDNEAKRDDDNFSHVACWEYSGQGKKPKKNLEHLGFEYCHQSQRSYK